MIPHRIKQIARVSAQVLRDGVEPLRLARTAIREHGAIQRTRELQPLVGGGRRFPGNQCHVMWEEIKHSRPHREFIDQKQPGGGVGIGVLEFRG